MDNMNEVFDAKVTIRGTCILLHLLRSYWVRVARILLDNWFCLWKNFQEVLEVIRSLEMWYALSGEDSVKVCLLLVSNMVFMGRESKNYIADNLIELVDDLTAHEVAVMLKNKKNVSLTKKTKKIDSLKKIETYNVYGFVWSLKYCRYILEMYEYSKLWWKKDLLVIPRGLALSKIGKFEKEDYCALFAEWSNLILSMAPTSTELLQPWLIRSMDYFQTLLFEQQSKQVVESVLVFTSEELVAEYHSITASVQLIENVGDDDPSIILKELDAIKQRMNATERFIKFRNDNLSEDLVAKQFVEKEVKSFDGKSIGNQFVQHPLESPNGKRPESSVSDVLNGEVSFDKKRPNIYHGESSKNEALSEEFHPKEYDKNVHESGDEKISESEIIYVLTGEVSCDKYVGGFYDGESSKFIHDTTTPSSST
nr:hypothetical protein [Tanacetum cinerariifolium]